MRGQLAKACYESLISCGVLSGSEILVIASVTEGCYRMASKKHINSSTTSTGGRDQAPSHSFLFPPVGVSHFHLLACKNNARHTHSLSLIHTHKHLHTHRHAHTDLLPRYVHNLTLVSKVHEHEACCRTKLSSLSAHRQIPSLYTSELFWTPLEIITHE